MNRTEGFIFDLDRVLCDTAKYHFFAWKYLADKLGIPFNQQDNERLKGVSRMESLDILLSLGHEQYSDKQKVFFADLKNRQYVKYIEAMSENEIFPGVLPFLNALRSQGYRIALGSVSKNAPVILNRLKISSLFDAVIDGNTVVHAKPDPEVFLSCAAALETAPPHCVVFEDAIAGIQAAHNAGMLCVGVGDPSILYAADIIIPGFQNLSSAFMNTILCLMSPEKAKVRTDTDF